MVCGKTPSGSRTNSELAGGPPGNLEIPGLAAGSYPKFPALLKLLLYGAPSDGLLTQRWKRNNGHEPGASFHVRCIRSHPGAFATPSRSPLPYHRCVMRYMHNCMYQRAAGVREMGGPISMTASTSTAQLNGRDGEATADLPLEERYKSAGRGIGAIGRSRLRALSQHLAIPHHEHLQYLVTILGVQLFQGKPCPLARVSSWQ